MSHRKICVPTPRALVHCNDLRIMGRGSRPINPRPRSARAPLIWELLQPVSRFSSTPALEPAFSVTGGRRSWTRIPILVSASLSVSALSKHQGASSGTEPS